MSRGYKRLRFEDRQKIEKSFTDKKSIAETAELIGVHRDTIYKELHRCGATRETYRAVAALQTL